jgi:hypothetical protein
MTRWLSAFALVLALAPSFAPSRADADATLFQPEYPFAPTKQREEARRRIRGVLHPTLGFSALARQGGRLVVLVHAPRGFDGALLPPSAPKDWSLHLLRRGELPAQKLTVRAVRLAGKLLELEAAVPAHLARDVYDLRVVGPGVDESQPNSVRLFGASEPERFRFAVLSDHQLWDPSYKMSARELNARAYPRAAGAAENMAIAREGFAELALVDPDFVLYLGDLVFGVSYPEEYDQAYGLLERARLPLMAVPGNHDTYADYVVRLKGGTLTLVAGAVTCRRHLEGDLTWGKAWMFITCVYGDVKQYLYADLHRDGQVFWRRQMGPPTYAFDYGHFRFVGVNTYDGSPERRHAFSIYMDALDLHLGAPAVDNYGGYLTDEQLAFVEEQAALAERRDQTLVVFGHHDPRGNRSGRRYHENEPFPTDPVSLGGFEEWNFDSKSWDSDPKDRRGAETEAHHSGHALLAILARHGGYYLSGHVHHDERRVYEPGSDVLGIRVRKRLEFIRTTTGSAGVKDDGYWGYRLLEARGRELVSVDLAPEHGLGSVPSGNLFATGAGAGGELELANGLPRATRVVVPVELPSRPGGYRFKLGRVPGDSAGYDPAEVPPRLLDVAAARGGRTTFFVEASLPAAGWPPTAHTLRRRLLVPAPARDNSPPVGVIDVVRSSDRTAPPARAVAAPHGAGDDAVAVLVGEPLLFVADRSHDREGDRIIAALWDLGGELDARGTRVAHAFKSPGPRKVTLTLVDEAGARGAVSRRIEVRLPPPPSPGCGGCCTATPAPVASAAAVLSLLGAAVGVLLGLRRRGGRGRR